MSFDWKTTRRHLFKLSLLALCLAMTDCGKAAKTADLLASAPKLEASPSASPVDAAAVEATSNAVASTMVACEPLLDKDSLETFMQAAIETGRQKQRNGVPPGVNPLPPSTPVTAESCTAYLQDSFEKIGALLERGAVEQQTLNTYVSNLQTWIRQLEEQKKQLEQQLPAGSFKSFAAVFLNPNTVGSVGYCATGRMLGGLATCNSTVCNGIQAICGSEQTLRFGTTNSGNQVLKRLTTTQVGLHLTNPTCPQGMTPVGVTSDCGAPSFNGSLCHGIQLTCAEYVSVESLKAGDKYVADVKITAHGAHANVTCPSTHPDWTGAWADCGGGYCFGSQLLCLKLATVPDGI